MLSKVQIQILTKLTLSKGLKYSEAQIRNIDNDLYNYHLQFLVQKDYVEKKDNKYYLTRKGKIFVQQIDSGGKLKRYFKVSVLPYVIKTGKRNRILVHKRLRHPYFGDSETIAGKVHLGENIEDAAKRKLKEETGLECQFRIIGVIRKVRRDSDENIIEDTIYNVCYGENPNGVFIEKNKFGENSWKSLTEAIKLLRRNITYSRKSEEILNRIRKGNTKLFYFQEDIVLKGF